MKRLTLEQRFERWWNKHKPSVPLDERTLEYMKSWSQYAFYRGYKAGRQRTRGTKTPSATKRW